MTFDELLREFRRVPPAQPTDVDACERALGRPLPADLRRFLLTSNGGEGPVGETGYLTLWSVETLMANNASSEAAAKFPGLFLLGSDGGGEAFALDLRGEETTFVMVPTSGLGRDEVIDLGHTFREFISSFDAWTASEEAAPSAMVRPNGAPMTTPTLSINADRLQESLSALGRIGAYTDEDSGLVGVRRLAFSKEDGEGRRHLVAEMKAAGLAVTVDRIGNVFGRRAGTDSAAKPVMAGSHIDSVATAGRFDGCLGVLGALEVVKTLNDAKRSTRRPLIVAFFSEEEGARFGTDMLGSAVATGRILLEKAYALTDRAGKTVKAELEAIGFVGEANERLEAPHAYVECHIEQGPMLRAANLDIGVVSGVQAISWFELTLTGKSAHAGTTPMSLRVDPGVVASRIQVHLREMVRSGKYGEHLRATMGVTQFHPGLVNVVPNRVTCTVDIRHPDNAVLVRAEAELKEAWTRFAAEEKVTLTARQTARTPDIHFAPKVQSLVAAAAKARGLSHQSIVSGAGHDCQEMARLCPAGMVFVPGEYDGISHNPRELSTPKQCADGVNVLLDVLLSLADEA